MKLKSNPNLEYESKINIWEQIQQKKKKKTALVVKKKYN